jgi:hypothetical protein
MKLTPERLSEIETQLRRRAAYHEAGHAAILWMFASHHDLHFIDMRGYGGFTAFVRVDRVLWFQGCELQDKTTKRVATLAAQKYVMYDLAGFAAEARFDGHSGSVWLDDLLDMDEWECDDTHDVHRAVQVSNALCGDNGHAWRFVKRMASWTDEALAEPRLWAVVESLAERLQMVKTRISGSRVADVMAKAWGEPSGLPWKKMGTKWRRRLTVKA